MLYHNHCMVHHGSAQPAPYFLGATGCKSVARGTIAKHCNVRALPVECAAERMLSRGSQGECADEAVSGPIDDEAGRAGWSQFLDGSGRALSEDEVVVVVLCGTEDIGI